MELSSRPNFALDWKIVAEFLIGMNTSGTTINRAQLLVLPALACAGTLGMLLTEQYMLLVIGLFAGLLVAAFALLSPVSLFYLYFVYLMFEGAFKIWSGYNPVVHVGSDLILILVFLRLWKHKTSGDGARSAPTPAGVHLVLHVLCLFWFWVLVQFFNPWGLGLFPSLAGLKVYAVPVLTFLSVVFFLEKHEIPPLVRLVVVLATIEGAISLAEWHLGPSILSKLVPGFEAYLTRTIAGVLYRPFGTTAVAGMPSIWIFNGLAAALLLVHFGRPGSTFRPRRPGAWNALLAAFVPIGLATILVCQVRLVLVRSLVVGFLGLLVSRTRASVISVVGMLVLIVGLATSGPNEGRIDPAATNTEDKIGQAVSRARSLEDMGTWRTARGGFWSLEEFGRRAKFSLMGVGLSRVGAAMAPWRALIEKETTFQGRWGFADSLYLAIFSELGLFGLISYLILAVTLLVQLFNTRGYVGTLCGIYCLVVLLSGYASEGVLYQPDASFFWLYAGVGLKFHGEGELA